MNSKEDIKALSLWFERVQGKILFMILLNGILIA